MASDTCAVLPKKSNPSNAVTATKCIVVKGILIVVQPVAQAVIGVFKVDTAQIVIKGKRYLLDEGAELRIVVIVKSSALARATSAKGSGFSKIPLVCWRGSSVPWQGCCRTRRTTYYFSEMG